MNNAPIFLEQQLFAISGRFLALSSEIDDIVKLYFTTGASDLVSAVSGDDTAITVTSKLTKGEFINGITICQQLQNFFGNVAVAGPSDYLSLAENLINGNTAAVSTLSADVEAIGDRLRALGIEVVALRKLCVELLAAYNSSELAAALVAVSLSTIVFGCSTTKQKLVDGMNLLSNFKAMMDSIAVTTGDYLSVVMKWTQGA